MSKHVTEDVRIEEIKYRVANDRSASTATSKITAILTTESTRKTNLIASIKVDNHELLPCTKLEIGTGRETHELPSVSILRRKTESMSFDALPSRYSMRLEISADGREYFVDEQVVDLNLGSDNDEAGKENASGNRLHKHRSPLS